MTSTLTHHKITTEVGTIIDTDGHTLYHRLSTTDDAVDIQGEIIGAGLFRWRVNGTRTNSGRVALPNTWFSGSNATLTQSGPVSITNPKIFGNDAGQHTTVNFTGGGHLGDLVLGSASNTAWGVASFSGVFDFDSIAKGHATNTSNSITINFDGSMKGTGPANFDNIAVSSDHGHLHDATLTNATVTGELNAWGVIEGAGNSGDIRHHGGAEVGAAVGTSFGIAA